MQIRQLLSDWRFALSLQLRWRLLAAAEEGAAASGAAGMPVRRPRRPAAASAALVAGAEPRTQLRADHERAAKPLIGEVRSLSVVCVCVSGLVGKVCGRVVDLPPWSVSSRVVCACWGSSDPLGTLPSEGQCAKIYYFLYLGHRGAVSVWGRSNRPLITLDYV